MSADDSTRSVEPRWAAPGHGMAPARFRCMGCDHPRPTGGARGVGVRKRCAVCVAKAGERKCN